MEKNVFIVDQGDGEFTVYVREQEDDLLFEDVEVGRVYRSVYLDDKAARRIAEQLADAASHSYDIPILSNF